MTPLALQARERWWVWAIPLLLVVIGMALLGNFLMALSGQGKSLLANVDRTEITLQELQDKSARLEARIEAMRVNQDEIDDLYDNRLSTESRRLTFILNEIEDLATQAGLKPAAVSYTDDELDDYNLHRKTLSFSVEGGYGQLRQLIHLLEQSESFLTLEQIGLTETGGSQRDLRINLRLSTLFAGETRS